MLLPEYKSKELLRQYGVPVPDGRVARSAREAEENAAGLSAKKFVVKAQIGAGGRGLAGGVRFAATPSSVHDEAAKMLGTRLVTEQTAEDGEEVHSVYVEAALGLEKQAYLAVALDPASGGTMLLASDEGGVEFEQRARMNADTVKSLVLKGNMADDAASAGPFLESLGIDGPDALQLVTSAVSAFVENDMTLLEINPLAKAKDAGWIAIDAKIALDPSAAFRHPEFETLLADQGLTGAENQAQKSNINFVKLNGNLGVVVNGAGLGLATNDMIADAGGKPANFMDIRTTATSFDIAKGVELLISDPSVKAILVNVHGGGMTVCDTVAEGVAFACSRAKRTPPIVARLAGVNAAWGLQILQDRKVPVEAEGDLGKAVKRAVALAGEG
jgi:succinyl-CoA synthetase beta subunit